MEHDTLSRNATFPARCNKEYYASARGRRGNCESVESYCSVLVGEYQRVLECAVKSYKTIRCSCFYKDVRRRRGWC